MANFADNDIQELLQQAEQRLSGGRIVAKEASTASTAKPAGEEDAVKAVAAPTPELAQVRVPQPKLDAQRKGKNTAGADWFDLPKTDMTPEFKRDWQLLRMRNVLDPKHQRKNLRASAPVYSQVGKIIASPMDPSSARLGRKERKQTLLEGVMVAHNDNKLAGKYSDIQERKRSGRKAFYKSVVSKRRQRN
ncbi:hypothetical protein TGAM01_v209549 [Trichoderma gamsii]|uniref:Fcf2 pre-rRNA processing C-terminal domain-containing protein n=1 Tax=Trichoderma gamsii TaxID=398673 RepID=A0A2P4ZB38_9HYPO|nr:hypothetical protein TGAM01_v209549 [Trichoderma gamsii]PON21518.1 hypothetical protein TGAM01_v209549 [Trichoderma gamsii]